MPGGPSEKNGNVRSSALALGYTRSAPIDVHGTTISGMVDAVARRTHNPSAKARDGVFLFSRSASATFAPSHKSEGFHQAALRAGNGREVEAPAFMRGSEYPEGRARKMES